MNRNRIIFLFSAIFVSTCGFGQFNTLKPISTKDNSRYVVVEEKKEEAQAKEKKNSFWNLLFGRKNREAQELKKELDSIKEILRYNNEKKSYDMKRLDSIVSLSTKIIEERLKEAEKREKVVEEEIKPKLVMPISGNMEVTSPFGKRLHPILKHYEFHNGVDIRANFQYVYAVLDGVVSEVGWEERGGNYIKVKHSDRFESSYLHLSEIYYKKGEIVKSGFVIAKSGNSGTSSNPHLHFAVKDNGKFIDPLKFLSDVVIINNIINTYENEKRQLTHR